MLVAKRGRPGPPMKRNTSMTEFTLDLVSGGCGGEERVYSTTAAVVPINHRKSADFAETAHFLRICSLCNHCLVPGHDIYMYRGDAAFCSVECRQRQMTHDERREKRSLRSKKGVATAATAAVPRMSAAV